MSEFLFAYEDKSGAVTSRSLLEVLEKVEEVEKVEKTGGGVSYRFECDFKGSRIGEAEIDLFDYDPDFYDDVDSMRGLKWLVRNSELDLYLDKYLSTHPAL